MHPFKRESQASGIQEVHSPEGSILGTDPESERNRASDESIDPGGGSLWSRETKLRFSTVPASWKKEGFNGDLSGGHGIQREQTARKDTAESYGDTVVQKTSGLDFAKLNKEVVRASDFSACYV